MRSSTHCSARRPGVTSSRTGWFRPTTSARSSSSSPGWRSPCSSCSGHRESSGTVASRCSMSAELVPPAPNQTPDAQPGVAKSDPILVAESVRRQFGGLVAVDVDHAEVQRNEITALIGPNGAGKTTFFNLPTGLDDANHAQWSFDGVPVAGRAPHKLARLGMVRTFQLTRALARLSVMQNMRLGATGQLGERVWAAPWWSPWANQERDNTARADELLERFRLDHMRDE